MRIHFTYVHAYRPKEFRVEELGYLEGQVAGAVIEHHISNTLATRYQHISK
jgi:hypothetical protein